MREAGSGRGKSDGALARALRAARAHPGLSLAAVVAIALGLLYLPSLLGRSAGNAVKDVIRAVRDGVVEGDVDAVMAHVSPYFFEDGLTYDDLRHALALTLSRRPVSRAVLPVIQGDVRGNAARLRVVVESSHYRGGVERSEWTVDMQEIDGEWLIRRISPVMVGGRMSAGLRSLLIRESP